MSETSARFPSNRKPYDALRNVHLDVFSLTSHSPSLYQEVSPLLPVTFALSRPRAAPGGTFFSPHRHGVTMQVCGG